MLKTTLAISCLLLSGAALADETNKFYIGAGIGNHHFTSNNIDFSGDATAFNLFGGIELNRYFSAELGYIDAGTVNGDVFGVSVSEHTEAFQGSLLGTLPIDSHFSAELRASFISWHASENAYYGFNSGSTSNSGTDFAWGVGGKYKFQNMAVRLEYEGTSIRQSDSRLLIASFIYSFK